MNRVEECQQNAAKIAGAAPYLRVFDSGHLNAMAKLFQSVRYERYYGGLLFYALRAAQYIPRLLAAIGVISTSWCVLIVGGDAYER